jgi:hypothetical protein
MRLSDVRSTLDSNIYKRTNKLLVEFRISSVRFLNRL